MGNPWHWIVGIGQYSQSIYRVFEPMKWNEKYNWFLRTTDSWRHKQWQQWQSQPLRYLSLSPPITFRDTLPVGTAEGNMWIMNMRNKSSSYDTKCLSIKIEIESCRMYRCVFTSAYKLNINDCFIRHDCHIHISHTPLAYRADVDSCATETFETVIIFDQKLKYIR